MKQSIRPESKDGIRSENGNIRRDRQLPEILFMTTYPPRECGIAAYSRDLITALNNKFQDSFNIKVAAVQTSTDKQQYTDEVTYVLETDVPQSYIALAANINGNKAIALLFLQHEFGLFKTNEADLRYFLKSVEKPIVIAFHTVLPNPDAALKNNVQQMNAVVGSFMVMTHTSAKLLVRDYGIAPDKITVIPHGTHLVKHIDRNILKEQYNLAGRKIISTFGLLSAGKSIETTLNALPVIIADKPEVLFLIIGKTHPSVIMKEGEAYRHGLEHKVKLLGLQQHVTFINAYLPLAELLDYLQLTDIYLFTSKDPNQAVSGTFSYALSCGCPVISTPIPHARELLQDGGGIIIDFGNAIQLEKQVLLLLDNPRLCREISLKGIHKVAPTAWENTAIAHALLFEDVLCRKLRLDYKMPPINLSHFKALTTPLGMIQFSVINQPDIESGYTLDDNARALVAMCLHFELTQDHEDVLYIDRYYRFIHFCQQKDGTFLNYVNNDQKFTAQNNENLEDANGRAIWALGYLISMSDLFVDDLISEAKLTMQKALSNATGIHSTRAMAFIIKGIYYSNKGEVNYENLKLMKKLADRLVQMYRHESKTGWHWFESYLTYGNSSLPEAMLCAYLATGQMVYKDIAKQSFDFLLSKIFSGNRIRVISNKGWLDNNTIMKTKPIGGEQPIDVTYTMLALAKFHGVFRNSHYLQKMHTAFSWFHGNNHLHQVIYNPCTGGCYDGLEENSVNLNQGAESTVSYLLARLTVEKYTGSPNYQTSGHRKSNPNKVYA